MKYYIDVNGSKQNAMKKNRGMEAKLQTSYILALWIDA
jgi:hypothetical protein